MDFLPTPYLSFLLHTILLPLDSFVNVQILLLQPWDAAADW